MKKDFFLEGYFDTNRRDLNGGLSPAGIYVSTNTTEMHQIIVDEGRRQTRLVEWGGG